MSSHDNPSIEPTDIAIVGMAGRFPGARDLETFWDLVVSGKNAFSRLSQDQLRAVGVPADVRNNPSYVPVAGLLEDVEGFDAEFFDIGPRDAALMDPQHRHFLECCWEALEDAGHVPSKFSGSIGVYAGSGMNGYLVNNLLPNKDLVEPLGLFAVRHTSNDKDFLSTGVSYRLNLRGPSVNVQTACSTSLVALHIAAQGLIAGECDMALAGGVTIEVPHAQGYLYREGEVLSRDGVCRAFDAASSGTVLTSGAGVVVLRRLSDAIAENDHIYAVVKATAINNDGASKVGYLAPSVDGHAQVVVEAQELAGVNPESIQYVEAHGTGTPMGDPIEVAALTQAFRRSTSAKGFARIGSTKPTVGHLDTAAGVASIIKTSLALTQKTFPPMAGYTGENPLLNLESSPFVLSPETDPWPRGAEPRRAGVSSLGVGGTNAHAILEEAPERPESEAPKGSGYQVLTLSGKSASAVDRSRARLADFLERNPGAPLHDVAWTLQTGRDEFSVRDTVAARTHEEAIEKLLVAETTVDAVAKPSVVFMFPGGGAQYPNMGRALYESEPVYRQAVDLCFSLMEPALRSAVRELLFPADGNEQSAAEQLAMPTVQLPAIFLTEYALAQLWISWGIKPDSMTGHSLGEYTAACLAGVFSLGDALNIVALRGRITERSTDAAMLSVAMPETKVRELMTPDVSLAAVNGPELCVVSGATSNIAALESVLVAHNVPARRLRIHGAGHCQLLDPHLEEFRTALQKVRMNPPQLAYVSNVTGDWVKTVDAVNPDYWVRHLRYTVRFADGLSTLLADPNRILIEIGPGNTLTALARQQRVKPVLAMPSLPHPSETVPATEVSYGALGKAWAAGAVVDWAQFHGRARRNRVSLPAYPFERTRHWFEPPAARAGTTDVALPSEEWMWRPSWRRSDLFKNGAPVSGTWLVVGNSSDARRTCRKLRRRGAQPIMVTTGESFERSSVERYQLDVSESEQWQSLAEQCQSARESITGVIWTLGADEKRNEEVRSYFGLVALIKGLASGGQSLKTLTVVTAGAYAVDGEAVRNPLGALSEGPVRVAPNEFEGLSARIVDYSGGQFPVTYVVDEALFGSDPVVAIRRDRRWLRSTEAVPSTVSEGRLDATKGVLITGGLGGLGLSLATYLSRAQRGAKIALLSRRKLPSRVIWPSIVADGKSSLSEQIRAIVEMEEAGAQIILLTADVERPAELNTAFEIARTAFGSLSTVIHAAGIVDDGPIVSKTQKRSAAVISPKVAGTNALLDAATRSGAELVVLSSSVSSELGVPGQVDYVAANAYLNAVAGMSSRKGPRVVSVPFGRWDEVGLASAESARDDGRSLLGLQTRFGAEPEFAATKLPELTWVFDEHRLPGGTAVMPGTGYLQLFADVTRIVGDGSPVRLESIEFVEPLAARDGQALNYTTSLEAGTIEVRSGRNLLASAQRLAPSSRAVPAAPRHDWSSQPLDAPTLPSAQHHLLHFGERWNNLRGLETDGQTAFASLALGDEFVGDLEDFSLHPALLDIALSAGIVASELDGESLFAPARMGAMTILGPLPHQIRSVSTRLESSDPNELSFNVIILDAGGTEMVCAAEGLTYRRVALEALARNPHAPRQPQPLIPFGLGLTPELAWPILEKAINVRSSVVGICSMDIESLRAKLKSTVAGHDSNALIPRPALQNTLEEPRDEAELQVASIWSECLGIQSIGIHDDFFELGGHSLTGLRVISRIQERFGLTLSLRAIQESPTVAAQAELIRGTSMPEASTDSALEVVPQGSSLVAFRETGSKSPVYCVHGMFGNVMNFKDLADALGPDQPFYGIEQDGLDGTPTKYTTVESMASKYVTDVRANQHAGPYALCGYSAGGWIAMEMARQLEDAGETVSRVILLDSWGPSVVGLSFGSRLRRMTRRLRFEGPKLVSRKLRYVIARRGWGASTVQAEVPLADDPAPNFALGHLVVDAIGHHRITPVAAPVTLVSAVMREPHTRFIPRDLGWGKTLPDLDIREIPAPHMTMCSGVNAKKVARAIADALDS